MQTWDQQSLLFAHRGASGKDDGAKLSKQELLRRYWKPVPPKIAVRCGLAYLIGRLLWLAVRNPGYFARPLPAMLEQYGYLLLDGVCFTLTLIGLQQLNRWRIRRQLKKGN